MKKYIEKKFFCFLFFVFTHVLPTTAHTPAHVDILPADVPVPARKNQRPLTKPAGNVQLNHPTLLLPTMAAYPNLLSTTTTIISIPSGTPTPITV